MKASAHSTSTHIFTVNIQSKQAAPQQGEYTFTHDLNSNWQQHSSLRLQLGTDIQLQFQEYITGQNRLIVSQKSWRAKAF